MTTHVRRKPTNDQSTLAGAGMHPEEFTSGEIIPTSGIYTVTHAEHRLPHQVTLLEGQRFPACSKCGNAVRYKIARVVGLNDRRSQILLYALPELEPEAESPVDSDPTPPPHEMSLGAEVNKDREHKARAKAHKKGKS